MIFPPLIFLLMLVFFFLALILLPFLMVGVIGEAFLRLGLSPTLMFWLLILTLLGSLVNIPVYTLRNPEVMVDQIVSYYGMRVRIPRGQAQQTVVGVNVGGAVIPVALSLYLLARMELGLYLPVLVGIVILVANRLARPIKGVGIALPGFIPPLVAALGAYLLCPTPDLRAPSAYIASTLGILIGADLLKLGAVGQLGAPVASVGGAGTFDAIFLGGIIAVLLS
jgi:uncharacterized membrane protein